MSDKDQEEFNEIYNLFRGKDAQNPLLETAQEDTRLSPLSLLIGERAGSTTPPPVPDPRLLPARQLGVRRAPPPEEMLHFVPVAATGARPPETVPAHRSGPTRKRIKLTGYRPHEALGINMNSEGQIMVRLARKGSAGHEWARLVETPRDLIATAISRQFRGNIPRMQGAQPK